MIKGRYLEAAGGWLQVNFSAWRHQAPFAARCRTVADSLDLTQVATSASPVVADPPAQGLMYP
jgi:hypothetical protein